VRRRRRRGRPGGRRPYDKRTQSAGRNEKTGGARGEKKGVINEEAAAAAAAATAAQTNEEETAAREVAVDADASVKSGIKAASVIYSGSNYSPARLRERGREEKERREGRASGARNGPPGGGGEPYSPGTKGMLRSSLAGNVEEMNPLPSPSYWLGKRVRAVSDSDVVLVVVVGVITRRRRPRRRRGERWMRQTLPPSPPRSLARPLRHLHTSLARWYPRAHARK